MRRYAVIGAALLASAACTTTPLEASLPSACRAQAVMASLTNATGGRVLVTAHRGVHDTAPENSLAAIRRAIDLGIDVVELDVRVTSDGVPILMHDETVDRTTDGEGAVIEMTLATVRTLQLLTRDGTASGTRAPTLAEALDAAGGDVAVLIDLKSTDIDAIAPVVAASPYPDTVFFYDSEPDVLARVRAALPGSVVQPIAADGPEALQLVADLDLDLIHLRPGYASAELSAKIDAAGAAGYINALGEIDARLAAGDLAPLASLAATRPDVVSTDEPIAVRDYLRGEGLAFDPGEVAPCAKPIARQASFSYRDIPTYASPPPLQLEAVETGRWKAVEARQGAAAANGSFYAVVNHVIGRYDRETGELLARWVGGRGGPIRHLNSCFVDGPRLLCANSNHPETPMASSVEVFDAVTLDHLDSKSLGIMDEGSLVWFDHHQDGWIVGFAHYNDETGLPFKTNAYAGVHTFDADWRRTGGWMLPNALVELMAPQAASGGAIGPDGLLYVMGHDRKEMYVLARPLMGPKLVHVATIAIEAEGQAFAFAPDEPRTVYAISRPNAEVRAFKLPTIPEERLAEHDAQTFH